MKVHVTIAALVGLGVLAAAARPSAELLNAAIQSPAKVAEVIKASATDQEAAQAVAQLIWMIQNGEISDADKTQRIALVVAEALGILGDRTAAFVGLVAERLDPRLLPVFTAAAVVSSGTRSPEVLSALLKVAGPAASSMDVVRRAAASPVAVLGAQLAASLPAPQAAAVGGSMGTQAAQSAPAASQQPVSSTSAGVTGLTGAPRPPGMAPRPPAMPYRGQ